MYPWKKWNFWIMHVSSIWYANRERIFFFFFPPLTYGCSLSQGCMKATFLFSSALLNTLMSWNVLAPTVNCINPPFSNFYPLCKCLVPLTGTRVEAQETNQEPAGDLMWSPVTASSGTSLKSAVIRVTPRPWVAWVSRLAVWQSPRRRISTARYRLLWMRTDSHGIANTDFLSPL